MAVRKAKTGVGQLSAKKKNGAGQPRCRAIAAAGVSTGAQFASLMSLLIGDIATGRIDPRTANAMCNAGGKLLKMVEMQHKYATSSRLSRKSVSRDLLLS